MKIYSLSLYTYIDTYKIHSVYIVLKQTHFYILGVKHVGLNVWPKEQSQIQFSKNSKSIPYCFIPEEHKQGPLCFCLYKQGPLCFCLQRRNFMPKAFGFLKSNSSLAQFLHSYDHSWILHSTFAVCIHICYIYEKGI